MSTLVNTIFIGNISHNTDKSYIILLEYSSVEMGLILRRIQNLYRNGKKGDKGQ
jgi:hypothetical protein